MPPARKAPPKPAPRPAAPRPAAKSPAAHPVAAKPAPKPPAAPVRAYKPGGEPKSKPAPKPAPKPARAAAGSHPAKPSAAPKTAAHRPTPRAAGKPAPRAAKPKAATAHKLGKPAPRAKPRAAVAHTADASLQQRVYEMCESRHVTDKVLRAVFLLCTAENNWNTSSCNSSNHCGLFQLDSDWQRQHNYRDIGYWLQFALDRGFYGHGGLVAIDRQNPGYSIGGIVQACQGAGPTWDAAVAYYNSRLHESDAILARYRHSAPAPVVVTRELYYNPLAHARVRPERIDQGVDYAGSGYLVAIADGEVGISVPNGSGWEGEGYLNYRITQPGPLNGVWVYYAEGITPVVHNGEKIRGGSRLCDLRSYQPHGIEIGFAAGVGELSYHAYHVGAYDGSSATRAGIAFSNLVKRLGGPGGVIEGGVSGRFPEYVQSGEFPGSVNASPQETGALGGVTPFTAPGVASDYTWPGAYYSAVIQLQRGLGTAAHSAHASRFYVRAITYVKPAS